MERFVRPLTWGSFGKCLDVQVVTTRAVVVDPEVPLLPSALVVDRDPEPMVAGIEDPGRVLSLWRGIALVRKEMARSCALVLEGDAQKLVLVIVNVDAATCEHASDIGDLRHRPANPDRECRLGLGTPARRNWTKDRGGSIRGEDLESRLARPRGAPTSERAPGREVSYQNVEELMGWAARILSLGSGAIVRENCE